MYVHKCAHQRTKASSAGIATVCHLKLLIVFPQTLFPHASSVTKWGHLEWHLVRVVHHQMNLLQQRKSLQLDIPFALQAQQTQFHAALGAVQILESLPIRLPDPVLLD